jgi:hypothetical protein
MEITIASGVLGAAFPDRLVEAPTTMTFLLYRMASFTTLSHLVYIDGLHNGERELPGLEGRVAAIQPQYVGIRMDPLARDSLKSTDHFRGHVTMVG